MVIIIKRKYPSASSTYTHFLVYNIGKEDSNILKVTHPKFEQLNIFKCVVLDCVYVDHLNYTLKHNIFYYLLNLCPK